MYAFPHGGREKMEFQPYKFRRRLKVEHEFVQLGMKKTKNFSNCSEAHARFEVLKNK